MLARGVEGDLVIGRGEGFGVGRVDGIGGAGGGDADAVGTVSRGDGIGTEDVIGGWGGEDCSTDGDGGVVVDGRDGEGGAHGCGHIGSERQVGRVFDEGGAGCAGAVADTYAYHGRGGLVEEDFRVPYDSGDVGDEVATATRLDAACRPAQVRES